MGVSGGGVCGWECVYEVWVVWVGVCVLGVYCMGILCDVDGMCCDVCVCGWVVL